MRPYKDGRIIVSLLNNKYLPPQKINYGGHFLKIGASLQLPHLSNKRPLKTSQKNYIYFFLSQKDIV